MKQIVFISLLIASVFCSCTKDPSLDGLLPSEKETVNGMAVTWRDCMTEAQRQAVRNIINDMVLVEGGIFMMGTSQVYDKDARENESPAHLVKLTNFYISAHELGYSQLHSLMEIAESKIYYKSDLLRYSRSEWEDVLWLLSSLTGLKFTFPTEAQWEYSARGGCKSEGYLYPGSNDLSLIWHAEIDGSNTSMPNELGLYNMADKQAEWCADRYSTYSDDVILINPIVSYGTDYVVRGGSYECSGTDKSWSRYELYSKDKRACRSTTRSKNSRSTAVSYIGCRPAININIEQ